MDCVLCSLGHVVEDELSWGQAAVGSCHSNVKKNKEKRSLNISLLSGCDRIHWFMSFCNR